MNSHVRVYLHFVWGTWDKHPFILPEFERNLWRELRSEVVKQNCRLLALGGTCDHVHLLTQFHSMINIADFVKQVKGASSLWVNEEIRPAFHFKRQGPYGAFSVGWREVPEIIGYIKKQKHHHAQGTTVSDYEKMNEIFDREDVL